MYGPPPDPRSVPFPAGPGDEPGAWALAVGVGLLLSALAAWRRPPEAMRALLFTLGQTVLLTAPLLGLLDRAWYGAFPTIDKEGSLLFYLDGVHVRALLQPIQSLSDPAVRLIGVHLGHLWPVATADLLLSPMGAFNAVALLHVALGWWAAWLLCREVSGDGRLALVAALPFGLGLHVFRDINWYTTEKAAVLWLALFAFALWRAARAGGPWPLVAGVLFAITCWMNLYLGLVGAALGGMALAGAALHGVTGLRRRDLAASEGVADVTSMLHLNPDALALPEARTLLRRVALANLACTLFALPLVAAQALLMREGPALASPERFLWERAALDSFTLSPLAWNRMELWPAAWPPLLLLAGWTALRLRRAPAVRFAAAAGLVLFLLSLGPRLLDQVDNPLYLALARGVPGLWRLAKPEVFFEGTFLLGLALAAVGLVRLVPPGRRGLAAAVLYALSVVGWLALVRAHPAFPAFSAPVESRLKQGWEERVFEREARQAR